MRTITFEGIVTALTSISHNGGEQSGIAQMLRRHKIVLPNNDTEDVFVISGNAIRGMLRDIGMKHFLTRIGYGIEDNGEVRGLPLPAFYFLFSGGSLTSGNVAGINMEEFNRLRKLIPLVSLFGGAMGNVIYPGKIKVNPMQPITSETQHLIPERFHIPNPPSIWDLAQIETYTRKDDEKNDKVRMLISAHDRNLLESGTAKKADLTGAGPQQMMYRTETIVAGTRFHWKLILEDVTDVEFEAMITTLIEFSKAPYIGGKSGTGHGEISIKLDKWLEIDSRTNLEGREVDVPLLQKYDQHLTEKAQEIREYLNTRFV